MQKVNKKIKVLTIINSLNLGGIEKTMLSGLNYIDDLSLIHIQMCIRDSVEYQQDGSTRNMFRQYRRHPQGWEFGRLTAINHTKYFKNRFRNMIHLVSTRIQLKKFNIFRGHQHPVLAIAALPFGFILYFYIRYKNRN